MDGGWDCGWMRSNNILWRPLACLLLPCLWLHVLAQPVCFSACSTLHTGSSDTAGVALLPGQSLCLGGSSYGGFSSSSSVDVELTVSKGESDAFALVLHPFEGAAGATIAYCWSTNTLQVCKTRRCSCDAA